VDLGSCDADKPDQLGKTYEYQKRPVLSAVIAVMIGLDLSAAVLLAANWSWLAPYDRAARLGDAAGFAAAPGAYGVSGCGFVAGPAPVSAGIRTRAQA
jgi:hypothetical protein